MLKFIVNFILVLSFFVLLESLLYYKDYNEVETLSKYIKYEIENNDVDSFSNERYEVIIEDDKRYTINFYRNSMFVFGKYKIIKYDGIVD